jgi:hypothetical protein
LALVSSTAWQLASAAENSAGGCMNSSRNSGAITGVWPRSVSAVANAVASRSGRMIRTRIGSP